MASVFVRNLPFGVTQEELEQVFSDIGPVKKIDVIKDKGKRRSELLTRGFAFVKFAVESDAAMAVEKLNKKDFQGRKMLIDYAMEKGKRRPTTTTALVEKPKQEIQEHVEHEVAESEVTVKEVKKERKAIKEERRAAKLVAKSVAEVSIKSHENTQSEEAKSKQIEEELEIETLRVPAAEKAEKVASQQSERNARRRQHREFLRNVERRKEEEASVSQKSVLIFGFSADVTQKHVLKRVKKIGLVDKVSLETEAHSGKTFALVQFKTTKDAALAVTKLDHHIFKGSTLQVKSAAKIVVASDGKPGAVNVAPKAEGLRLIVRNLAFQSTEMDLEKLFGAHGPLFEARIVRMPVDKDTELSGDKETSTDPVLGRSRGFGFVQYRDVADARAAVEKLNGTKLNGREMIVDFALSKTKYLEQQTQQEGDQIVAMKVEEEEENSGDEDEDQLVMATDDEDIEADSDDLGEEHPDIDETNAPAMKEDTETQRERTLFIRNLSFQTSEDGLRRFFEAFGAIEYARVVYDKGSGLAKGVGFVRFKSADVALEVLKRGKQPHPDDNQKHKKNKKKPNVFTLSALASGGNDGLTLDGRQLILSRAVSKVDAEHLADANARERRHLDKRNLYLAHEGTLNVNKITDAELELPKMDIDKRRRAIREKKLKLQNPMYFVSPLRLSVRNLSTALDDRQLKKLAHDAADAGLRANLVNSSEIKPELTSKGTPPIKVRMAKIVRDMESAKDGKEPRSRGYGFVEFSDHSHALAALRHLNNNPKFTSYAAGRAASAEAPDSAKSRLIVEFALENHGKLKLREKRAADAAKTREEKQALKEALGEDLKHTSELKKSRGQRQREKKKLRAEAKVEIKNDTGELKTKKVGKRDKKVKPLPKKRKCVNESRADTEVDALASLETGHVAKKSKTLSRSQRKHVKELQEEQSFDTLVRNYKEELFGEKAMAFKEEDNNTNRVRWFD